MDEMRTRLANWWTDLDDATKTRVLALDEDDPLPADVSGSLVHASVLPAVGSYFPEQEDGPEGFRQPQELRAFLAEQRDQ